MPINIRNAHLSLYEFFSSLFLAASVFFLTSFHLADDVGASVPALSTAVLDQQEPYSKQFFFFFGFLGVGGGGGGWGDGFYSLPENNVTVELGQ